MNFLTSIWCCADLSHTAKPLSGRHWSLTLSRSQERVEEGVGLWVRLEGSGGLVPWEPHDDAHCRGTEGPTLPT